MQTEFKFRGIVKGKNQFAFGDLIHGVGHKFGNLYILPTAVNLAAYPGCDPLDGLQIEPISLGQFALKKDKNGIDIYKGDIVKSFHKIYNNGEYFTEAIVFDFGCWRLSSKGRINIPLHHFQDEELEVIGNIYQNPELINE